MWWPTVITMFLLFVGINGENRQLEKLYNKVKDAIDGAWHLSPYARNKNIHEAEIIRSQTYEGIAKNPALIDSILEISKNKFDCVIASTFGIPNFVIASPTGNLITHKFKSLAECFVHRFKSTDQKEEIRGLIDGIPLDSSETSIVSIESFRAEFKRKSVQPVFSKAQKLYENHISMCHEIAADIKVDNLPKIIEESFENELYLRIKDDFNVSANEKQSQSNREFWKAVPERIQETFKNSRENATMKLLLESVTKYNDEDPSEFFDLCNQARTGFNEFIQEFDTVDKNLIRIMVNKPEWSLLKDAKFLPPATARTEYSALLARYNKTYDAFEMFDMVETFLDRNSDLNENITSRIVSHQYWQIVEPKAKMILKLNEKHQHGLMQVVRILSLRFFEILEGEVTIFIGEFGKISKFDGGIKREKAVEFFSQKTKSLKRLSTSLASLAEDLLFEYGLEEISEGQVAKEFNQLMGALRNKKASDVQIIGTVKVSALIEKIEANKEALFVRAESWNSPSKYRQLRSALSIPIEETISLIDQKKADKHECSLVRLKRREDLNKETFVAAVSPVLFDKPLSYWKKDLLEMTHHDAVSSLKEHDINQNQYGSFADLNAGPSAVAAALVFPEKSLSDRQHELLDAKRHKAASPLKESDINYMVEKALKDIKVAAGNLFEASDEKDSGLKYLCREFYDAMKKDVEDKIQHMKNTAIQHFTLIPLHSYEMSMADSVEDRRLLLTDFTEVLLPDLIESFEKQMRAAAKIHAKEYQKKCSSSNDKDKFNHYVSEAVSNCKSSVGDFEAKGIVTYDRLSEIVTHAGVEFHNKAKAVFDTCK